VETIAFLVFFLAFAVYLLTADGFAVDPENGKIFMEPYKYLTNFIQMPAVLVVFVIGVVCVLFGIVKTIVKDGWTKGIWFSGFGTVLTVMALLLCAGWNNTAYYPSVADLQSSLTIQNSSSSVFTLTVMSFVSCLIPFVLAYIVYAWYVMNKKKITDEEVKDSPTAY
jgi:cytochrome d ubiquinol oxidase subunit II